MKYKGSSFLANPDVAAFSEATEVQTPFSPAPLDFEECKGMFARVCAGLSTQDVSLRDPSTSVRMRLPCRGIDCTHLQCFDFTSYKQINEQHQRHTSEYRCPVCNELRNPSSLFLDPITYAILSQNATQENISFLGEEDIGKFRYGTAESDNADGIEGSDTVDISSLEDWIKGKGLKSVGSDELKRTSLDDLILFINTAKQEVLSKVWSLAEKRCHQIIAQRPFCCSTYQSFRHALQVVPGIGTGRATTYIDLLYDHLESVRGRGKQRTYATVHGNQLAVVGDTVAYKDILRNFGGKYVKRSSPTSVTVDGSHVDCWLLDMDQKGTILKSLSIPFKGTDDDDGTIDRPPLSSVAGSSKGSTSSASPSPELPADTTHTHTVKVKEKEKEKEKDEEEKGTATSTSDSVSSGGKEGPAMRKDPGVAATGAHRERGGGDRVELGGDAMDVDVDVDIAARAGAGSHQGGGGSSPSSSYSSSPSSSTGALQALSLPTALQSSGSSSGSSGSSARSDASTPRIEAEPHPLGQSLPPRPRPRPISPRDPLESSTDVAAAAGTGTGTGTVVETLANSGEAPSSSSSSPGINSAIFSNNGEGASDVTPAIAGTERVITDYDEAERSGKHVYLMDYSNDFCAVFGLLKSAKDRLKALGGKFLGGNFAMHRFVRNPDPPLSESIKASGWRFPAERRQDLVRMFAIREEAQQPFPHPPTLKFSKEDAFNRLEAIKSYNNMSDNGGGAAGTSSSSSSSSSYVAAAVASRGHGNASTDNGARSGSDSGGLSSSSSSHGQVNDSGLDTTQDQTQPPQIDIPGPGPSGLGDIVGQENRVSDNSSSDGDCSSSSNDDSVTSSRPSRVRESGEQRSSTGADADGVFEEDGTSTSASSRSGSGSGDDMLGRVGVEAVSIKSKSHTHAHAHGHASPSAHGKVAGMVQRVSPGDFQDDGSEHSDESGGKKRRVGEYPALHTGGELI